MNYLWFLWKIVGIVHFSIEKDNSRGRFAPYLCNAKLTKDISYETVQILYPDWAPICAFPVVAFSTILLPILSFRRRDTPYAFAKFQDEEFEVRHGIASLFRKDK